MIDPTNSTTTYYSYCCMYIVRFVSDDMWRGRVVRKKNKKLEQKRKSLKPRKCSKTLTDDELGQRLAV